MNIIELQRSLRKLRLGSMALSLETRLVEAQSAPLPHLDFLSALVTDELTRRADRLIERRVKQATFRDAGRTLDGFDFTFNPKMNRRLVFELAAGHFIDRHEDVLFLGPPGTGNREPERHTSTRTHFRLMKPSVSTNNRVRRYRPVSGWRTSGPVP